MIYRTLDIEQTLWNRDSSRAAIHCHCSQRVARNSRSAANAGAHPCCAHTGGVLLLVEGVRPDRWLDLTLGLTDGWWRCSTLIFGQIIR